MKQLLTFLIVYTCVNGAHCQHIPSGLQESGFIYEEIGDFSSKPFFVADIIPARCMAYGTYFNIGVGAGINIYNIANKLSIETDFVYNYYNLSWYSSSYNYGIRDFEKKSSQEFSAIVGYTIFSTKKKIDTYTEIKKVGNTLHYSMLPATNTYLFSFHAGFKQIEMYNISDPRFTAKDKYSTIDYYASRTVIGFFRNNSIYLGANYARIVDTRYKTDKFGEISARFISQIYGGILIGLKPEFPTIYNYQRNNSSYPLDITSFNSISIGSQQEIENDYNLLPFGFRFGYTQSRKGSGFGFNWEVALYPGYNRNVLQQLSLRFGITFGLQKTFE